MAGNAEIYISVRIKDSYFGLFCGGLSLERLALPEIRDGLCKLPKGIIQSSVELRCPIDADRLRSWYRLNSLNGS